MNITEFNPDYPIHRGNVCVSETGLLFVAIVQYVKEQGKWYGIAFNGKEIHTVSCAFVAENVNDFLQKNYGTDFASILQEEKLRSW